MTDEPDVEEFTQLGAQLPPVPPDEVPGMLGLRDLTPDEHAQFKADSGLIRAIAPMTPYTRAAEAVRALGDIVDALEDQPSVRAGRRFASALRAVAHAVRELPDALVAKVPHEESFAETIAGLKADEAFRRTSALDEEPAGELSRETALRHLAVALAALDACAHLAASWLLVQREDIDAASRRIARLGGEVIEGVPAVMTIRIRRRSEGDDPEILGWVPDPLPLIEIQTLQTALRKADDLLADEPREPAMRGARAMYGEQVAATLGISTEARRDQDEEDAEPDPAARALDFDALMAHLHDGAVRLELAWSRALKREDVATLAGEWISFLQAMAGEVAHADRDLEDEQAHFELPVPEDDLVALPLDGDDAKCRIAETIAVAWMAQGVDSLQRPTTLARDASDRAVAFFSSGAFTRMRDQLALLAAVRSAPSADRPPELVHRAVLRGDPEAVVLHAAALLRRRGDVAGRVQKRILEAADRLVAGEATNLATITVLADAALPFVSES